MKAFAFQKLPPNLHTFRSGRPRLSSHRTTIVIASRAGERALSRTSRGGAGCDGTVAAVEALRVGADKASVPRANVARVTCDSRGRTAQGPSNATTLAFHQAAGDEVALGVCKPLIRRVRSAGVKTTVHRCDSLLVCANAHQAAGSHNAQAFRTPFRGRTEAAIWRGEFEEKARDDQVASPGADKPGAMTRVRASAV